MNIEQQFNLIAEEYDGNRRKFIPCFDDYYGTSTDFIARSLDSRPKLIFDLGAGTGLLTSFWFRHFPEADYVLSDIAEEMLEVARKRFERIANVRCEIADYSEKLPAGAPDVVVSALSIHHLEHDKKQSLFRALCDSLPKSGIFVNYDQFCAESAALHEKIERHWAEGVQASGISQKEYARWKERKKLDRECSVPQEIAWLKSAGFRNADCIYLSGKFAVILAEK